MKFKILFLFRNAQRGTFYIEMFIFNNLFDTERLANLTPSVRRAYVHNCCCKWNQACIAQCVIRLENIIAVYTKRQTIHRQYLTLL